MSANAYALTRKQTIKAPNGYSIVIWEDFDTEYVRLSQITKALGYNSGYTRDSLLGAVFRLRKRQLLTKSVNGSVAYMIYLKDVIPVLQEFIRLTLTISGTNRSQNRNFQDNARMEAERLIEILNVEVFGKPSSATVSPAEQSTNQTELNFSKTKEDIQMDNNAVNVPVVTVADLEDINDRAEAIAKIFGASKKDALRAAVTLKSPEINRELTPLLELLA